MVARHMKKIRNTHNTTIDSRKAFFGNIVTIIVSFVFLGVSYLLVFKTNHFMYRNIGYIFFIWGAMGIAYVLKETLKSLWQADSDN